MGVRSARLAIGRYSGPPLQNTVLYTVPALRRTIVKWYSLVRDFDGVAALVMRSGSSSAFVARVSATGQVVYDEETWQVMNAGDTLELFLGTQLTPGNVGCNYLVSGTELVLL